MYTSFYTRYNEIQVLLQLITLYRHLDLLARVTENETMLHFESCFEFRL